MIDGKLLIVGRPVSQGAAGWLRCEQHLNVIAARNLAYCPVIRETMDDPELAWKAKCMADVFVGAGWPVGAAFPLMKRWLDGGKPIIWDVDDDPLNISPYNFAYEFFGLEEVPLAEEVNGQKWLWRDGVGDFNLARNRQRHKDFLTMLGEVSAVTTTTPYLANKLRGLTDKTIYIRPNVLDFEGVWTHRNRRSADGKVRILYQGGASHAADLDAIMPALHQIAADFPHVIFVFQGDTKACSAKQLPTERVETFDWTGDYSTFAFRMADIGADIAIAPLCMDDIHAEFNRCKSALKWLDAAALAIPSVCQKDTPYKEVVNFGRAPDIQWNGLLAGDFDEWYACLSALIQSSEMRQYIGHNALIEARNWWSAEDFAEEHMRQYEEVVDGNGGNSHAQDVAGQTCTTDRA